MSTRAPSRIWPTGLISFGDRLAFWHTDGVHGWELWLTDGTPGGTAMAFELVEGPGGAGSRRSTRGRGRPRPTLLPGPGRRLRQGAGGHRRVSGRHRVFDLVPGPNSSDPWAPLLSGHRVFFSAMDLVHGHELWALELALFVGRLRDPATPRPGVKWFRERLI